MDGLVVVFTDGTDLFVAWMGERGGGGPTDQLSDARSRPSNWRDLRGRSRSSAGRRECHL